MDKYSQERHDKWMSQTYEELVQQLANAQATFGNCIGHTKAHLNKIRIRDLKRVFEERNLNIPTNEELYGIGVYNGKGAV